MATKGVTRTKTRKPKAKPAVEPEVAATVETPAEAEKVEAAAVPEKADIPEPEKAPEREMPKELQERVDAVSAIYADLQKEIEEFKSGQAYLEGDIPITMRGLGGPGFDMGQRSLNWIDTKCLDPLKHYRWSNKTMVDYHRGDGYRPCDAKEFTRMVKARGGGHHFDTTPEGHIQSGDLIMIETSKDWHEQLKARTASRTSRKETRVKNNLYQTGEQLGVDVYEGSEAVGPKMGRLLEFLEKELGPGVTQAFLGR